MRTLKSILGSIKHAVTTPLDDLIEISALLESPRTDHSLSDGPPISKGTAYESTLLDGAVSSLVLQQEGAPHMTDPQEDNRPKILLVEKATLQTTSIEIIDTAVSTPQHVLAESELPPSVPISEHPRADSVTHPVPLDTRNGDLSDGPRDVYEGPGSRALGTAKSNALKAYETISMHGTSSAIFGDVHLSDQQGEKQIIRFEDTLGRFHRVPYDQCRSWAQMRTLIHYAFRHKVEFMPYIEKDEYHLIGPDREIILPAYWEHAVIPGMLIRMTWLSPDLEAATASTVRQAFANVDSIRLQQYQTGSLPHLENLSKPTRESGNATVNSISGDTELSSLQSASFAAFVHEDYETAISKLSKMISISPSDHNSYLLRSRAYLATEAFGHALRDILLAIELKDDSAAVWIQMGAIEYAQQNHQDAKNAFERAVLLDMKNERARKGLELATRDLEHITERTPESTSPSENSIPDAFTDGDTSAMIHDDRGFEQVRLLGQGTYGVVNCVRERSTGIEYAQKVIPTKVIGLDPSQIRERVRTEAAIMAKLRHKHIAQFNMAFQGTNSWSMLMLPVAECDLRMFLDDCARKEYPYELIRLLDPWFGCLVSALAYAHNEMIKHEDIKPSNILVKGHQVFLTDFGTAKDFSEMELSTSTEYMEAGTPIYWAPERRPWGRAADVFALGCVFAEMLTVRQKRSLSDFRQFRRNSSSEFGYAYRSSLPKTKRWLKDATAAERIDSVAWFILNQIGNMMAEDPFVRIEANRVKRNMRAEDQLFCSACF